MKVTGIIAEYNPFHNGHLYQMNCARKETGADFLIVVMSPDFVQRGTPALINKYSRTKMALAAGADLVLELPVYYAAASADYFSLGAVSLLDKLGCVNHLSFGSESGRLSELSAIAAAALEEKDTFRISLNSYLRQGMSYADANARALCEQFTDFPAIASLLKEPNNMLAIAYLKALLKRNSTITPHTVQRRQSAYHDTDFGALSATSFRQYFSTLDSLPPDLKLNTTASAQQLLKNEFKHSFPVLEKDISTLLLYKLHSIFSEAAFTGQTKHDSIAYLTDYVDVSEELAGKIFTLFPQYEGFEQFCLLLKSKELTYSRISRALLHILLDIKKSRLEAYVQDDYISYARILGFRKSAAALLSEIKSNASIPLISKLADAKQILSSKTSLCMLKEDIAASDLYERIVSAKFKKPFLSEYRQKIIKY